MKVLITGSKGFIGKYLLQELKSHEIVEFDKQLGNDVLNSVQLMQKMQGVQAVIHLAAALDEKNKEELQKINVDGTWNVLESAKNSGVKKFIYLSSVGVYGSSKNTVNENTSTSPLTEYEKTKLEAEKICRQSQGKMNVIIIRSAMIFGANKYWKQIINMIQKGFPLINGGKNFFQFVYVKDLANAIAFLLEKNVKNETFIVAMEKPITLRTLYIMIQKHLHIHSKIKEMPEIIARIIAFYYSLIGKKTLLKQEYISRLIKERNYSIEKIKKLGWSPAYSTEQAIDETLKELGE
ncbi:MAG: NAD(P)-dependent oxidoreductase [archaeon]|nr:NAD(P)-dependent oxidoreductase [archaeon]